MICTRVEGLGLDFSAVDDAALVVVIARSFGKADAESTLNDAVGALYERYGRLVYSVAFHMLGDIETAEEITQDVFVRVCTGADGYRSQLAKVSTWLVSITRHRAIDELRRRKVRPEKEQVDWPDENGDDRLDVLDGLADMDGAERSLERSVESTLHEQVVRQVVALLPEDQRQVLRLAYFKGMSQSEIATLLGEPLGTIKSRVRLAMVKLRDSFLERGIIDAG
ncbi:MAG: RNA polymerase subunit sigma-70 [Chloroflexi bacterium HGW-Chloroflexi-8]|nr:MAG: RNA polymerase subunit sigma-70 [Chloroflexi bacterium HGW-Chloroflexi-8]